MLRRPAQHAFTLIELLVAISLAVLMLWLINAIFNEVTVAVRRGIATSHIINSSRAVGEQISRDGRGMVAPGDGGILIILNQEINAPVYDARYGGIIGITDSGLETIAPIRSDQILFIYDNRGLNNIDELNGVAPGTTGSFTPNITTGQSRYARIWYGHVARTDRGSDGTSVHQLGDPDGPNYLAHEWILGRQPLFFRDQSAAGIHVNHVRYFDQVQGYGGQIHSTSFPTNNPPELYWGLTDVAYYSFNDPNSPAGDPTGLDRQLIGTEMGVVDAWLDSDDTANNYRDNAFDLIFGVERLRTNPTPEGPTFTSSEIAQMHPYFMGNVSDFIVQFAADARDDDSDGNPDLTPDIDVNGDIEWYDMDNPPTWDTVVYPSASVENPNHSSFTAAHLSGIDYAFLWRHHQDTPWPYLIRIRYRLHDRNGELTGVNEFRLSDNLDNDNLDGDDNLTTGADDAETEAVEVGKWFEVIIPVNRS